jgi:hypothetical protein
MGLLIGEYYRLPLTVGDRMCMPIMRVTDRVGDRCGVGFEIWIVIRGKVSIGDVRNQRRNTSPFGCVGDLVLRVTEQAKNDDGDPELPTLSPRETAVPIYASSL